MTTTPVAEATKANLNRAGLDKAAYKGSKSTLCAGCGHDAITNHIITAFYELGVEPQSVAKFSGIGCSSKTPAYFLSRSCGFNSVHGRMPAVATGALTANRQLIGVGVSGDGDSASIGLNHMCQIFRRNVRMLYIVENNGVYGLTKGQFSATADVGSRQKGGALNDYEPIDTCALAIELGCGYVARSFSGDGKQLVPLLKGALSHNGLAFIDVISPCVTFNNHDGSTKSYDFVKEHDIRLHELGFVPHYEEVSVEYDEGTTTRVDLPDGSYLTLKKLERTYDPFDKKSALSTLAASRASNELLTGLLFLDENRPTLDQRMKLTERPLIELTEADLRPGRAVLEEIMETYR
ncbi:MAG: 2-oxoacid:ferredoxin oxidoreductase subunit beta [Candidatus Wallbacteria bacterium]|nr:2-oxoacid:ferredoxin oxidoreductase subunit beta [Candidatus Wallbacteria bacterium]